MKRVINYILNPLKTNRFLTGGFNCDYNNAYEQFVQTKRNYGKETGRQYMHFTQNFAPGDKITPEEIKKIADELVQMKFLKGFEIVYAVHTDREHLHTHFVVNSVNAETGLKWKQSAEQLQIMKDYSDNLCRKKDLSIIQGNKGNYKNRGEYRSENKEKSWKHELFLAINKVKWISKSKDNFIKNMGEMGYKVDWTDTRKYITFTTPGGKKCRNRKLYPPENFTKEALFKAFEQNVKRSNERELNNRMELLLSAIQLFKSNSHGNIPKNYPLSAMEGKDLKNKIAELKKGKGIDWDKISEQEI